MQQRQLGAVGKCRAFEFAQRLFRQIQQSSLQKVHGQAILRPCAISSRQVGARQQVLVHPNGAFVLSTPPEQATQRKVQFSGIGIFLHRLDKGIDRGILLFVEQMVQPLEIRLGRAAVFGAQLAQVQARRQPAQCKNQR